MIGLTFTLFPCVFNFLIQTCKVLTWAKGKPEGAKGKPEGAKGKPEGASGTSETSAEAPCVAHGVFCHSSQGPISFLEFDQFQ